MLRFLKNILEVFGIVYLRFRTLPRLWCVWLVAVNAACLLYITQIEGQVVLAVTAAAVVAQAIIYGKIGFTRIMGATHILWVPMFAWMTTRLDTIATDPSLASWLALLAATNLISMIIDTAESVRFLRGDRAPNYYWKNPMTA